MPTLNFLTNRCPRIFTLGQPLSLSVPALFLGDSKYDHQAASAAGLDFVFLSGWNEVANWQDWVATEGITVRQDIRALTE